VRCELLLSIAELTIEAAAAADARRADEDADPQPGGRG